MEVPKKIYLVKDLYTNKPMDYWYSSTTDDTKVEYTRTDAFIEKALKFLDENFFFNNFHHGIESGVFDSEEEMFEDFKNYIKNF